MYAILVHKFLVFADAHSLQEGSMHVSIGSLVRSVSIGVRALNWTDHSHSYTLPNSKPR